MPRLRDWALLGTWSWLCGILSSEVVKKVSIHSYLFWVLDPVVMVMLATVTDKHSSGLSWYMGISYPHQVQLVMGFVASYSASRPAMEFVIFNGWISRIACMWIFTHQMREERKWKNSSRYRRLGWKKCISLVQILLTRTHPYNCT